MHDPDIELRMIRDYAYTVLNSPHENSHEAVELARRFLIFDTAIMNSPDNIPSYWVPI